MWRNSLIALAAVALLAVGLGIIVYVGLARDRIVPTPIPPKTTLTAPPGEATPTETSASLLQVRGSVRDYSPGALIMVIVPSEGKIEQIIMLEDVQIAWADGRYAAPQDIVSGQAISAEGTLDTLGRLMANRITISPMVTRPSATLPAPTSVSATPKPTQIQATSVPPTATRIVRAWRGEYYGSESLRGAPLVVRTDAVLDMDWQLGAPAPGVPTDSFSVRWRGRWPFEEGNYRFYAYSDDGVRVWVNGVQVIEHWQDQSATLVHSDLRLQAGEHDVQVEYYDALGNARVHVWWERVDLYPNWKATYFANSNLSGNPVLVRNDITIAFDWGTGSPASPVPGDDFSVRWSQVLDLDKGSYLFWAVADDGVRFYLDGNLLLDEWHDGPATRHERTALLDKGAHALIIEYYERRDRASIQVGWDLVRTATPSPTSQPTYTALPNTPTFTPIPPTATPTLTMTPIPSSATPTPTRTAVPAMSTPTPTFTSPPATATATLTHTVGVTPSSTRGVAPFITLTATPIASPSTHPTVSASPSSTSTSSANMGAR
jgi:hypothetical protein